VVKKGSGESKELFTLLAQIENGFCSYEFKATKTKLYPLLSQTPISVSLVHAGMGGSNK
jgi:hypothetical protein